MQQQQLICNANAGCVRWRVSSKHALMPHKNMYIQSKYTKNLCMYAWSVKSITNKLILHTAKEKNSFTGLRGNYMLCWTAFQTDNVILKDAF